MNLLLTTAVIRKLRKNPSQQLGEAANLDEIPAGMHIPSFVGASVSGSVVTPDALSGADALIAFFDTGCDACKPAIGEVVQYALSNNLSPRQVVAVVCGEPAKAGSYLDALGGVATVITEDGVGPVTASFSPSGTPVFCIVDADGVVVRSGHTKTGLNRKVRG
ncbi:hypothetical protein OG914_15925 [Streptomyces sp. NBC_00291]|uniref:TlpA family protein disulfide reductase n=1 Tax=Streptomyces sp. NBC_00291 TaxID=2975704 RepID=UPI0022577AF1|nr:hypothetical protein [Streptomyces sp. NBC_00291]MCX5155471.1 hypothetical protein [Streptomyces sp. NBC_00291]